MRGGSCCCSRSMKSNGIAGICTPKTGRFVLDAMTLLYAWHSLHHVAHITHLRAKEDW